MLTAFLLADKRHIESVYLNLDMEVKLHVSFFDLTQAIVVMC
jgi:hypothetical protein